MGAMFKLLTEHPLYLALAAAVLFAGGFGIGFGSGWKVNGWRLGAEIQRLAGENTVLRGVNERCGVDVDAVRAAVKGIADAADERARKAAAAMKGVETAAKGHLALAAEIAHRPPAPPEKQCETVTEEQREYVRLRRKTF